MQNKIYLNVNRYLQEKISIFNNIYDSIPKVTKVHDVLLSIKNGTYKTIIDDCRYAVRENNYNVYNQLKAKIPAVTFAGEFIDRRIKENCRSYTQLIILDFDRIERIDIFEIQLRKDPYIFAAWISPSGTGYKVLIKLTCSLKEHCLAFDALVEYFDDNYKLHVDISGSDITRLCILSFDPMMILNQQSQEWDILKKIQNENLTKLSDLTFESKNSKEKLLLRKIYKFLRHRNLSITESYEMWYKVAYAISNTFSCNQGLKYFLELCRLDGPRHSEEKSKYIFEYCFRNNKKKIAFSTLLFYAKEKGFKI